MDRIDEQTLLQARHTNGQQTHEKMLNITCHLGKTNQNHTKIPPYASWNGKNRQGKKQLLERVWRKGIPPTVLVGMQVCTATLENRVEIPYKVKNLATL